MHLVFAGQSEMCGALFCGTKQTLQTLKAHEREDSNTKAQQENGPAPIKLPQDVTGAIAFPAVNAASANLKYPVILQVLRKLLPYPFNIFDLAHLLISPQAFPNPVPLPNF